MNPPPGAAAVRALRQQALQQRAAGQAPAVQALLAARAQALAPLAVPAAGPVAVPVPGAVSGAVSGFVSGAAPGKVRGPLGRLADGLQAGAQPAPELAVLQRSRSTWERLSAGQRVQQALAQVPAQAGPLNTSHLIHRALGLMQAVAPGYLQHFVPYVDTLLWLQGQPGQAPGTGKPGPKAAGRPRRKAKP